MGCTFRNPDKTVCGKPAFHNWGPVLMCCDHFDAFVAGMLDLNEAIRDRRHSDFVAEYAKKTQRASVIPGADCDSKKKDFKG